jgi:hypothetical protein
MRRVRIGRVPSWILTMTAKPAELYEHTQLMPPFHRFPDEGARIGRIMAAFGELQFILGLCLGEALNDQDTAMRTIFQLASDRARIDVADSLLRPICTNTGLDQQFAETMNAVRFCHSIRNQYAHCHYADQKSAGLFLTNLQEAAHRRASFEYLWRHIDVPLLDEQERYFRYTTQCLNFIYDELRPRLGRTGVPSSFPWPTRLAPPPKHNLPSQHVPPWLNADQQQRQMELAVESEQGAGLRPRPPKSPKAPKPSARARREAAMKKRSQSS